MVCLAAPVQRGGEPPAELGVPAPFGPNYGSGPGGEISPGRLAGADEAASECVKDGGDGSRAAVIDRPEINQTSSDWAYRLCLHRSARHCCPAGRSRISLMARRRGRLRMKAMISATSSAVTSALS
jgi:hypothetical protein